jgi:hypothetical protein
MTQTAFRLPAEGELFTDQIITRSKGLIEAGVWEGMEPLQIDVWMSNFTTREEQYFAACVLDALVYRSEQQTVAMMRDLFDMVIPNVLRSQVVSPAPRDWFHLLQDDQSDPQLRIVPVIRLTELHRRLYPHEVLHVFKSIGLCFEVQDGLAVKRGFELMCLAR